MLEFHPRRTHRQDSTPELAEARELRRRVRIDTADAGSLSSRTLAPVLEGATLVDHPDGSGVRVATVEPCSRAARNGLRPDDVIVAVNRRPVRDLRQFREQLQNARRALGLTVQRGLVDLFIVIQ